MDERVDGRELLKLPEPGSDELLSIEAVERIWLEDGERDEPGGHRGYLPRAESQRREQ